jgi:hypothetical protein
VAGAVVTVVALVVGVVFVASGLGRAPAPVTVEAPLIGATPLTPAARPSPTSVAAEPSPTAEAGGGTRIAPPPSLPSADRAVDRLLWDGVGGGGVRWSTGCSFNEPIADARSDLTCLVDGTPADGELEFELYRTGDTARSHQDGRAGALRGAPGSCESGGRFSGEILGRHVTCGTYRASDGTTSYILMWTKPEVPATGTLLAGDPGESWAWFVAHDPF